MVRTTRRGHLGNRTAHGMMIAAPPSAWRRFVAMTAAEFAGWLHEVARGIDWRPHRKRPRGPK